MADAIHIDRVSKSFGDKVAVNDLSLAIPERSMYGFIGPNGAGKTTTIRMVMSILFQDSGEIRVLGHRSALEAKDRIGYLPEERGVYRKMKVGAFLRYMGELKGIAGPSLKGKVRTWLERVGLGEVENKKCEELSKGMQQKIQFISAILHEPDLLILDEPFSGLDPVNMRLLRELIDEQHRRGATVIFSTHVMVHAELLCDHIVMINGGRKVIDDTLSSIRAKYRPHTILFEPLMAGADLSALGRVKDVVSVTTKGATSELRIRDGATMTDVMREVVGAIPAARVEVQRPNLEDIFIQIVTGGAGPQAGEGAAAALRASLHAPLTS